jgi:hypothetical protein
MYYRELALSRFAGLKVYHHMLVNEHTKSYVRPQL